MTQKENLKEILDMQKKAHLRDGPISAETRIEWINKLILSLIKYQDQIAEVISKDFNHRSNVGSMLTDVSSSITSLKLAKKNIKKY